MNYVNETNYSNNTKELIKISKKRLKKFIKLDSNKSEKWNESLLKKRQLKSKHFKDLMHLDLKLELLKDKK